MFSYYIEIDLLLYNSQFPEDFYLMGHKIQGDCPVHGPPVLSMGSQGLPRAGPTVLQPLECWAPSQCGIPLVFLRPLKVPKIAQEL